MTDQARIGEVDHRGQVLVERTGNQEIYRCPCCGHTNSRYRVQFSTVHVQIAKVIFKHCIENKVHEFHKDELNLSHTGYGNLCFLQRFGLIYYLTDSAGKKKRGSWGVPVKRLGAFLRGEWKVAEHIWRDVNSGTQEISEKRVLISEIKNSSKILDPETMLPLFVSYDEAIAESGFSDLDEDDIVSTQTVDLSKATGNDLQITGTSKITSIPRSSEIRVEILHDYNGLKKGEILACFQEDHDGWLFAYAGEFDTETGFLPREYGTTSITKKS